MTEAKYQPGDLDRLRWALEEAEDISQSGVIRYSRGPKTRALSALHELERRKEAHHDLGHHHGDGDFCQCRAGQISGEPRVIHWYLSERHKRGMAQ